MAKSGLDQVLEIRKLPYSLACSGVCDKKNTTVNTVVKNTMVLVSLLNHVAVLNLNNPSPTSNTKCRISGYKSKALTSRALDFSLN